MKILVVSQWFPPEPGGGPARFHEMAQAWASRGHEVTVVAGMPNWPTGVTLPGYGGRMHVEEHVQGFTIHRTWVLPTPNEGRWRRVANHVSYVPSALITATLRRIPADVVVGTSPPLFAAAGAQLLAAARRVPFVFDVRDLWPDAIFALGQMRYPLVRPALRSIERHLYRRAGAVVVVSPGFAEHVRDHGGRRVEVITNGADLQQFQPGPSDPAIRREFGWDDRFVVLYAGTVGMAHGLGQVLEAAPTLRDPRFLFVLMGEGAEKEGLRRSLAEAELDNVQILPLQPRDRMPAIYRSADACLVSLRPIPLFDAFIPSKIFEIMACGRPILAAVGGTALELVLQAEAGLRVVQGDGPDLRRGVEQLAAAPELAEKMGASGRAWAERNVDRAHLAGAYLDVLTTLVSPV
jgi:colanic acid biosynthesis glycosyl transferase WcaI